MGANGTVHDAGDGCWAYVQRDGSWGWSNAGLIVGDGTSLLVDTLFDLKLTKEMLDAFAAVSASHSQNAAPPRIAIDESCPVRPSRRVCMPVPAVVVTGRLYARGTNLS